MKTTVKDLKKFLDKFDGDVEVEFVVKDPSGWWDGDNAVAVQADLSDSGNWEYLDANKNPLIKEGHPAFGRKILTLGED